MDSRNCGFCLPCGEGRYDECHSNEVTPYLTALKEASIWLHVAYDHPLQTPESVAMLARIDAALGETK